MMKYLGKFTLAAVLVSLVQVIANRGSTPDSMYSFFVVIMNFFLHDISSGYMVELIFGMTPILIFEVMAGIYLYSHFCTADVYYFSRQVNRIVWFSMECLELLGYTIWYYFVMAVSGIIWGELIWGSNMPEWTGQTIGCVVVCVSLLTMFTYIFTILINIISIKLGSQNTTLMVIGIQYIFVVFLNIMGKAALEQERGYWRIRLNPISNMIVKWHSNVMDGEESLLEIDYPLSYSYIYYGIGILIVFLFGCILVKKHDIGLENKEEQG